MFEDTVKKFNLNDIYRTLYPQAAKYTFSDKHETVNKIDYVLVNKVSL